MRRISKREYRENRRFENRERFDQAKLWDWNRAPEPRSLLPSTWPALEAALHKWGVPAGWRNTAIAYGQYRHAGGNMQV